MMLLSGSLERLHLLSSLHRDILYLMKCLVITHMTRLFLKCMCLVITHMTRLLLKCTCLVITHMTKLFRREVASSAYPVPSSTNAWGY
jgi:hypothetical protein